MLNDIGVDAQYIHDGMDHKQLRKMSSINENKSRYKYRKSIMLVRDPRDTVVSGYFHVKKRNGIPVGSFGDFIRNEMHGIEKIIKFNMSWFAAMPRMKYIRYIQYEDIHRGVFDSLKSILDFLEIEVDQKSIATVAENRTFEKMKSSEAKGDLGEKYGGILLPGDVNDPESFKVRRGKIGGYRDYLSEDDIAYCNDILLKSRYWMELDKVLNRNGLNYQPLEQVRHMASD